MVVQFVTKGIEDQTFALVACLQIHPDLAVNVLAIGCQDFLAVTVLVVPLTVLYIGFKYMDRGLGYLIGKLINEVHLGFLIGVQLDIALKRNLLISLGWFRGYSCRRSLHRCLCLVLTDTDIIHRLPQFWRQHGCITGLQTLYILVEVTDTVCIPDTYHTVSILSCIRILDYRQQIVGCFRIQSGQTAHSIELVRLLLIRKRYIIIIHDLSVVGHEGCAIVAHGGKVLHIQSFLRRDLHGLTFCGYLGCFHRGLEGLCFNRRCSGSSRCRSARCPAGHCGFAALHSRKRQCGQCAQQTGVGNLFQIDIPSFCI